MTDRIRSDPGAMSNAVADITGTAKKLDATADEINTDVNTLFGTWTEGLGKEAYNTYQKQWDTIFADVKQALMQLGNAVEIASGNYVSTDKAIADAFNV